jgi:hypothetical protein
VHSLSTTWAILHVLADHGIIGLGVDQLQASAISSRVLDKMERQKIIARDKLRISKEADLKKRTSF